MLEFEWLIPVVCLVCVLYVFMIPVTFLFLFFTGGMKRDNLVQDIILSMLWVILAIAAVRVLFFDKDNKKERLTL